MTLTNAKRIMQKDIYSMSLEQLQKHKVRLLDIWQIAKGRYGYNKEFFKVMIDDAAEGYTPRDMFLLTNLNYILDKIEIRIKELLKDGA